MTAPANLKASTSERLERAKLAADIRLKRLELAIRREELDLAQAKVASEKQNASGFHMLFSSTGVVLIGAAIGLLGTAAGKYGDYVIKKREQETSVILKASDVPAGLSLQLQAAQRAKNLLWFSKAGYIDLPDDFSRQLERDSGLKTGEIPSAPIVETPSNAPSSNSVPGAAGLKLISEFEGFQATPYKDPAGWTMIGAEHKLTDKELNSGIIMIAGKPVHYRDGISPDQSKALLIQDMAPYYQVVDKTIRVHLTTDQRDALASFVLNVGAANFTRSHIPTLINSGQFDKVPDELKRWTKAGGKEMSGLVQRRAAEASLWQKK